MKDLIFSIPKSKHTKEDLEIIFEEHPEIKFVSVVGIDLSGNDTDEKIPAKLFLEDIDSFLEELPYKLMVPLLCYQELQL